MRHLSLVMPPLMRIVAGALALAAATSCTDARTEQRDRCTKINEQLSTCAGTGSPPLDCSTVSDADVDRIDALTGNGMCSVIASTLPLDGDPKSATCRLFGVGCVAALTPAPEPGRTTYPIVLVNGIDTSPLFRYSERITKVMKDAGYDVHLATLTPYEPPRIRAPELYTRIQEIRKQTGAAKVNLVCHSLGGLDCRYLVSQNGAHWEIGVSAEAIASQVASITTIGTAHRGTKVADRILDTTPSPNAGEPSAIDSFAALAGDWFSASAIQNDAHLRDALAALSVANAPAFNDEIVDASGVLYQSWAGVSRPRGVSSPAIDRRIEEECGAPIARHDWMALPLVPFVDTFGEEPSDGLTTVASAKWGEFRGCIPADHMEQLGQRNLPDANVENGFDVARFYAGVAKDLADRGM